MTMQDDATQATPATTRIGAVGLVVRDLDAVRDFYREVIGLEVLQESEAAATLGAGGRPLIHLREDRAARPDDPRQAGLFHIAFLLPTRAALGAWLRHAAESGVALEGASDHLVSEALYLSDPEGNGIEIYADRPRSAWRWAEGQVEMDTLPLDLQDLAAAAEEPWRGMPEGTTVGHIHLRVGSLEEAEAYYRDRLGLDLVNARYPGGRFFSRGGYHHDVGANTWRSRGAGPREAGMAGLDWFELAIGGKAAATGDVEDPWGNRIRLVPAA